MAFSQMKRKFFFPTQSLGKVVQLKKNRKLFKHECYMTGEN